MVFKRLFDNFEQVFWIIMQVLMKILCVIDFFIFIFNGPSLPKKNMKREKTKSWKNETKILFAHIQCQNGDQTLNNYYISFATIFIITFCFVCRNPNIGFATKCEIQRPMRSKIRLVVKHTLTNGRNYKGWSLMTPKCTITLGVAFLKKLWMFRALVGKVKKHQIEPPKHR